MADIQQAVRYVLTNEDSTLSGTVTTDAGGKTRFGIAAKYNDVDPSFYTMPAPQALPIAEAIYAKKYAAPVHADLVSDQALANKMVDMAVNPGIDVAGKLVQTSICDLGIHVDIDGQIGTEETIPAINNLISQGKSASLMSRIVILLENWYRTDAIRNPALAVDLNGWLRRAARVGI